MPAREAPSFEQVFRDHFDFVWRLLRSMGVAQAGVEDAAQDVFVVVLRKLPEFEARGSLKSWLFSIALGVARNHRRSARRKGGHDELDEQLADPSRSPAEAAEIRRSVARLQSLLDALDEELRTVLVLSEIEQMTAPEIAELTGWNVNTVSSRLRRARQAFEAAVARTGGRP